MTYTATTATGERLTFDGVSDAMDWAEANVTTDWNVLWAHRFDAIDPEWLARLTPGQIDDVRPLRHFHLVRTEHGAIVCQNDDHAMLDLASEWGLASLSITDLDTWCAPADIEAMRTHFRERLSR